jgi:hypothetical protein
MIRSDHFIPFFGVIENVKDPKDAGRVQVRIYGHHPRNRGELPVEQLPWVSTGNNTSCLSGIGSSVDYVQGTTVFGFMLGSEMQSGIVVCSLSGIVNRSEGGFNDPDGNYPTYPDGEPDINRYARTNESPKVDKDSLEPSDSRNVQYPNNRVYQTPGGILIEYDDSPDSKRINIHHPSGSYFEILNDGTVVNKSNNSISISKGDRTEVTRGDKDAIVDGNINVQANSMSFKSSLGLGSASPMNDGTINVESYFINGEEGDTGVFISADNKTITVKNGLITSIE